MKTIETEKMENDVKKREEERKKERFKKIAVKTIKSVFIDGRSHQIRTKTPVTNSTILLVRPNIKSIELFRRQNLKV